MQISAQQESAIQSLQNPASVVAVTGQQVGLFGGPMYTLYKIRSAVQAAQDIENRTGVPCVPIFWIEDNDHDAREAMSAKLLFAPSDVINVTPYDGSEPRLRVGDRALSAVECATIDRSCEHLVGRYAETTRERMKRAYIEGASWSASFLDVLAPYLAHWGVLPMRSSLLVTSGLHSSVLEHLLRINTDLVHSIRITTADITARGEQAQAAVLDVPWMYTTSAGRQRIEPTADGVRIADKDLTVDELLHAARTEPHRFTPTVLTRPMVQDAVLPSVVSVLGKAELAYHCQLPQAYVTAGLTMPALQLRSGGTMLSTKTLRNVNKSGHEMAWFLRPWQDVERDVAAELTSDIIPSGDDVRTHINQTFEPYQTAAQLIDPTLVATVNAQRAGMIAATEALEGKLRSAAKKKHTASLERAHAIHTNVFPLDTLQERVYPLAMWEAEFGTEALLAMCDELQHHELGTHVHIQAPAYAEGA
jgi:bacillithiol biosynthesis cysteine-adding enzyme BshC